MHTTTCCKMGNWERCYASGSSGLGRLFKINVHVFEYDWEQNCLVPYIRSAHLHTQTMYVLLHDNRHFCFIKDIDAATHSFGCPKCGKLWKDRWDLYRHVSGCDGGKIKAVYPGGVYHPALTPLEILKEHGINVDPSYVYPFRATYDFETYFKPIKKRQTKPSTWPNMFRCR